MDMLKIRCKRCNIELASHDTKTHCCGCDNMTTIRGEVITANDLRLVEIITNSYTNKKNNSSLFSREDLEFQESRRNRKVRKLDFEIK